MYYHLCCLTEKSLLSSLKVAESGPFMGLRYRLSVIAICHASQFPSKGTAQGQTCWRPCMGRKRMTSCVIQNPRTLSTKLRTLSFAHCFRGTAARRRRTTRTVRDDADGCNWVRCDVRTRNKQKKRERLTQPRNTNRNHTFRLSSVCCCCG